MLSFEAPAPRRTQRVGIYLAGSVAVAAACVALVFVGRGPSSPQTGATQIVERTATPAPSVEPGASGRRTGETTTRGLVSVAGSRDGVAQARVSLVTDSLVLSGNSQAEALLKASVQSADDQLAWIRSFQLVSLEERKHFEQLHFETAPASLRPEGRQLGGQAPTDANVEMTAFRFRK